MKYCPISTTLRNPAAIQNLLDLSCCCEGTGDVIGVVAHLRGVAQVGLHGDQVVELSVLLGVHQEGGVEEDGEGQVEVGREEVEVKERRSWMTCGWDED